MKWVSRIALILGIIAALLAFLMVMTPIHLFIASGHAGPVIIQMLLSILAIILGVISITKKAPGRSIAIISIVLGVISSIIFIYFIKLIMAYN
jgi:hypothetical protein